jgi:hypothetical protein
MKFSFNLLMMASVWLYSCKVNEGVNTPTTAEVSALACSSVIFSSTPVSGSLYTGTASVPYTGGNGLTYAAGSAVASSGVTGLTATLQTGTLASGAGNAKFSISGTPAASGTATFAVSLGGQSCNLVLTVTASASVPVISGFSPSSGITGASVIISGSDFSTTIANNVVKFNGTVAVVSAAAATSLTTTVPVGATTGKVTVSIGNNTASSTVDFTVTTSASGLITDNNPLLPACTTAGVVSASSATSIVSLRNAMVTFRNSLTTAQLTTVAKCLDDNGTYAFTKWHNTPAKGSARGAMRYGELSAAQLTAFKAVLQAFMSSEGYKKANEITTLAEGYLNTLQSGMWDPDYYWIDLYGNPASSGSWGFQLDGHHLALNFLVHGEKVNIAPAFVACEPCAGTFNGTTFDIVKDERDLGLSLYGSLSASEITAAVSDGSAGAMSVGPSGSASVADPYGGTYSYAAFATGLKYSDMIATTKAKLIAVMKEYVYNLKTEFADTWWALIEANIDNTYFAWKDQVSAPSATTQFYYRVYNPYLWIEYAMENPVGSGIASYNHAHTITRIPYNANNGGDYGIFAMMMNNGPTTIQEHYDTDPDHQRARDFFDDLKTSEKRFANFRKKTKEEIIMSE